MSGRFELTEEAEERLERLLSGFSQDEYENNWAYFNALRQRHISIMHDKRMVRRELRENRDIYNRTKARLKLLRNKYLPVAEGANQAIREAWVDTRLEEVLTEAGYKGEDDPRITLENTALLIAIGESEIEDYRDAKVRIELEMRMCIADMEGKERIYD